MRFIKTFFSIARSYGESLIDAFRENEYTQKFQEQCPRLFRFLKNRLSLNEFLGLHLTIGFFVVLYLTTKTIEFLRALTTTSLLLEMDTRLMNFLITIRTKPFVNVMLFVTSLANWPTIAFLFLLSLSILLWKKQWFRAWILFLAVGGSGALAFLLKIFIIRPRPEAAIALLTENTYGFPSGHALVGLTFYGCLCYFFLRSPSKLWKKFFVLFGTVLLIVFIGFSRLYLGVHWPSDVFGGTLIGLVWLAILVTAVEIRQTVVKEHREHTILFPIFWVIPLFLLLIMGTVFSIWSFAFTRSPFSSPLHEKQQTTLEQNVRTLDRRILSLIPSMSEGLTGRPIEPVSLLLVGSEETVKRSFQKNGWFIADPPRLDALFKTMKYFFFDISYSEVPVTPAFLFGEPQTIAFEKPTEAASIRERHHIRLWRHATITVQGKPLWLGTTSFDTALKLAPLTKIPTHKIAPAIDRERDFVVRELEMGGAVAEKEVIERYEPFLGVNFVGDPFFTDGRVIILFLQPR